MLGDCRCPSATRSCFPGPAKLASPAEPWLGGKEGSTLSWSLLLCCGLSRCQPSRAPSVPWPWQQGWQAPKDTDNGRLRAAQHLTLLPWSAPCCFWSCLAEEQGKAEPSLLSPWLLPISSTDCVLLFLHSAAIPQRKTQIFPAGTQQRGCPSSVQATGTRGLLCSGSGGPFGMVQQDFSLLSAALCWRCCSQACCQTAERLPLYLFTS